MMMNIVRISHSSGQRSVWSLSRFNRIEPWFTPNTLEHFIHPQSCCNTPNSLINEETSKKKKKAVFFFWGTVDMPLQSCKQFIRFLLLRYDTNKCWISAKFFFFFFSQYSHCNLSHIRKFSLIHNSIWNGSLH